MNYKIVELKEKYITGLAVRTSNADEEMGRKIGGLWQRLYGDGIIAQISGRIGANTYGLYTNYESDVTGKYDVIAGCEVNFREAAKGLVSKKIPAGRYACFSLIADMEKGGVGAAWQDIWAADLKRLYTVDFEEYLPAEDISQTPVNIYIAIAD